MTKKFFKNIRKNINNDSFSDTDSDIGSQDYGDPILVLEMWIKGRDKKVTF